MGGKEKGISRGNGDAWKMISLLAKEYGILWKMDTGGRITGSRARMELGKNSSGGKNSRGRTLGKIEFLWNSVDFQFRRKRGVPNSGANSNSFLPIPPKRMDPCVHSYD